MSDARQHQASRHPTSGAAHAHAEGAATDAGYSDAGDAGGKGGCERLHGHAAELLRVILSWFCLSALLYLYCLTSLPYCGVVCSLGSCVLPRLLQAAKPLFFCVAKPLFFCVHPVFLQSWGVSTCSCSAPALRSPALLLLFTSSSPTPPLPFPSSSSHNPFPVLATHLYSMHHNLRSHMSNLFFPSSSSSSTSPPEHKDLGEGIPCVLSLPGACVAFPRGLNLVNELLSLVACFSLWLVCGKVALVCANVALVCQFALCMYVCVLFFMRVSALSGWCACLVRILRVSACVCDFCGVCVWCVCVWCGIGDQSCVVCRWSLLLRVCCVCVVCRWSLLLRCRHSV